MAPVTRFPVRFTGFNKVMAAIGLTPRTCYVDVGDDRLDARMGWGFSMQASRASVQAVDDDHDRVYGWGAHGWRGRWLINGSSSGIVRITLDPRAQAHVLLIPRAWTTVRTLRVAVEDPEGLVQALTT